MELKFDKSNNVVAPQFVLATKSGRKLGVLPAYNITFKNRLNSYSEAFFRVNKYDNGVKYPLWDKLKNLKLIYCPTWNMWYEAEVETNEENNTVKNVSCKSLGAAELSQIMLYNIEINTADDIAREQYSPTVLYNPDNKEGSLLNRIMEKAPNYKISHVDESVKSMQRTFQFDNISLYDAFMKIAEEIKCLFIIDCKTNGENKLERTINIYDLETVCNDCGNRGDYIKECSECGSKNVKRGYGEDTSVYVSVDNLADSVNYSVNTGQIKNCFRLEAGDDLMTAVVISCNPNGSEYVWQFSKDMREDMSEELNDKITHYDEQYGYFQTDKTYAIPEKLLTSYNAIIGKYKSDDNDLKTIPALIKGYPQLMNAYYGSIEAELYLKSVMMPSVDIHETTAGDEIKKLTSESLSPVSVINLKTSSESTVVGAVAAYARVLVDNRYQVKTTESVYSGNTWTGKIKITRYSDEEDTAVSNTLSVTIDEDHANFVKQKIDKKISSQEENAYGITALFKLSDNDFKNAIKKYGLSSLKIFYDGCQACLDILTNQGVADKALWEGKKPNLYLETYIPYFNKLEFLHNEISERESEINVICGQYDKDGLLISEGMQTCIEKNKSDTQKALNLRSYLGEKLWLEFAAFRREDTYKNENYISDGLSNDEIFRNALSFIKAAEKEIYKSAMLQHSISATLKNLLVMKEFAPLTDKFTLGNWIRIRSDDKIFRLRLIEFGGDFDNLSSLSVEFSDILETADGINDWDSILKQVSSIASSYDEVTNQAEAGEQSFKHLKDWVDKGLDVTNQKIISGADNQTQVWDSHGMLFREHDEFTDNYSDLQLKIINSTLAMTNDNWKTIKTAVGKYYFFDQTDGGKLKIGYGVNAETVIGKMILGEQLGIYTDNGSMSFDKNGLNITNNKNNFNVNPNSTKLLTISNDKKDIFWVDDKGVLHICGDGAGLDITANNSVTGLQSSLTQTAEEIRLEVGTADKRLSTRIDQTEEKITLEAERASEEEGRLSSRITANADGITSEVERAKDAENTLKSSIEQNADKIRLVVRKGEDGTSFEVNPNAIRVAWNDSNNYIQLENGGMNIYSASSKSGGNLLMRLDNTGSRFYYKGTYVGKIGTNHMVNSSDMRGLSFDLDGDHDDYMAWAHKEGDNYMIKFAYWVDGDLLRSDCPLEARNTFKASSSSVFNGETTFNGDVYFKNSSIDGISIKDNSISGDKIQALPATKISGYISSGNIGNSAVGEAELANNSVTTAKIASGSITPRHMDEDATVSETIYLKDRDGNTVSLKFLNGLLTELG